MAKPKVVELVKASMVDNAMRDLRYSEIELSKIEAGMNAKIDRIVAASSQRAQRLFAMKERATTRLQDWWENNRPPGDAKSLRLNHGRIGVRAGKPSLKLLIHEAEAIKRIGTGYAQYLHRPPEELDRAKILREKFALEGVLEIEDAKDNFYADPDLTSLAEPARKEAA